MITHPLECPSPGDHTKKASATEHGPVNLSKRSDTGLPGVSKKSSYSQRMARTRFVKVRHSLRKTTPSAGPLPLPTALGRIPARLSSLPRCVKPIPSVRVGRVSPSGSKLRSLASVTIRRSSREIGNTLLAVLPPRTMPGMIIVREARRLWRCVWWWIPKSSGCAFGKRFGSC
jgi:hypothetical protein